MWLVPELTTSASSFLKQLLGAPPTDPPAHHAPIHFEGQALVFENPGSYPVMVAAPWDGLLANWIRTSDDVAVQSVCREALELGFIPTQPSGFCADLWWLEVRAPCRFEPSTNLHHGVVALGLLERLTDAHSTATSFLEVYPGGKLMGWPERAFVQWSYDDGEALTLELRAADAHATLTYASVDLKRAAKILHSLFEMTGGVDTRLEPRPAFHVGLDEVYAS